MWLVQTLFSIYVLQQTVEGFRVTSAERYILEGRPISCLRAHSSSDEIPSTSTTSWEEIADQEQRFKIVTCMSTACCEKRKVLGMDSLSTYGAMYSRALSTNVQVDEGPCLGSCTKAPCVGIEHDDFIGCVALEGMTDDEFRARA
jgi:hypothetical protein